MILDHGRANKLKLKAKKLYASPLFEAMRPTLKQAYKYSVERLIIDKTGFTLRFLFPFGYETRFDMAEHGFPPLSVEKQEALLLLLEEFVPKLTEHDCYCFRSVRHKLLDGQVEYQYKYIIRIDYKNMLARAPYYDGTLQSQLW
ncbi:MAG: hypothetical protein LLF96_13630 [Eubacteriales bacterium]|nr:hypothetical protein [Eubacteriales bacterium]